MKKKKIHGNQLKIQSIKMEVGVYPVQQNSEIREFEGFNSNCSLFPSFRSSDQPKIVIKDLESVCDVFVHNICVQVDVCESDTEMT